jgi:hypothetical protein
MEVALPDVSSAAAVVASAPDAVADAVGASAARSAMIVAAVGHQLFEVGYDG